MNTILVPLDFSDVTTPVVETAGALARAFHAKLVLLHVVKPVPSPFVTIDRFAMSERGAESAQLKDWQQKLQTDGFSVETSELAGDPADCIREEAQRHRADYVVIGSHGHGALYDLVMGSTAISLLKKVGCPVILVPVSGSREL